MRTLTIRRGILLSASLAVTISLAACAATKPPNNAGPSHSHTVPPAASPATSPPVATPVATPGGVQNLVISSAERAALTAAFAYGYFGISPSDLLGAGPLPGSVYYAYDPATYAYWAMATFAVSPTASPIAVADFRGSERTAMFQKTGTGAWQVALFYNPTCGAAQFFPAAVLAVWWMPSAPARRE